MPNFTAWWCTVSVKMDLKFFCFVAPIGATPICKQLACTCDTTNSAPVNIHSSLAEGQNFKLLFLVISDK
uniref:Putative secreted protein n=1 Tax=Amblyomma triste TaxID=251400 RepID=A0A023G0V9_AMBTT